MRPRSGELIDRTIRALAPQQATPPERTADSVTLLVQVLRERHYLLILDNFESLMEPGALAGTYRPDYAENGALVAALGTRVHQSCLVLTNPRNSPNSARSKTLMHQYGCCSSSVFPPLRLDSFRRRSLIEHALDRPAFTLQPVLLDFVTDRIVEPTSQKSKT